MRKPHALYCDDPSLAIQSQALEADINTIVKNFGVTGQATQAARLPVYGDFDTINDYQTAVQALRDAEAAFLAVPSKIRAEFNHDAAAFADYVCNPANLVQLREWGLAPTPPPPPEGA